MSILHVIGVVLLTTGAFIGSFLYFTIRGDRRP